LKGYNAREKTNAPGQYTRGKCPQRDVKNPWEKVTKGGGGVGKILPLVLIEEGPFSSGREKGEFGAL